MPERICYESSIKDSNEFKKLMIPSMIKCIERYKIDELLEEVRSGKESHISSLVYSFEPIILMTIKVSNLSHMNIQGMYEAGVEALTELAISELNSKEPEVFFSYGAWHILQCLLKGNFPFDGKI